MSTPHRLIVPFCFLLVSAFRLPAQAPSAAPDYSHEDFVIENRSVSIVFADDGTSERLGTFRIRVQSESAVQSLGVVVFPYAKATESIDIDYVRVQKANGTVVSTPIGEAQDVDTEVTRQAPLYSDSREKHLAVKALGTGDVLEYQARTHVTKALAPRQFWESYNFKTNGIVLKDRFEVRIPHDRQIKWKSAGLTPVITDSGTFRVVSWSHAQLAKASPEEDKRELQRALYLAVIGQSSPPEIQLSSFASWEELGRWYQTLQEERAKPTPEVRAKAQELTAGLSGNDAKIRALYHYVSLQFRYIGVDFGVGRYQPHAAAEVLGNQFGDCKDKHTLFAALLNSIGIQAFPALISSTQALDRDVPSPAQFNHVISVIPDGSHLLWLDTTPETAPFGYLMNTLSDKPALVVRETQNADLTITPKPAAPSIATFRFDGKLSEDAVLDGDIKRTDQNSDSEVVLRYAFRRVPGANWKELVQQISIASGFSGEASKVTTTAIEKTDEPFGFSYHYNRKSYPDFANKKVASALPPIVLPALPEDGSKPENPLRLGFPGEMRLESRIELPTGYLAGVPKKLDLNEDFAEYHNTSTFRDGVLTSNRTFLVKLQEVPASEYAVYKNFLQRVEESESVLVPVANGPFALWSYQEEIWTLPGSSVELAAKAYAEAQARFEKRDYDGQLTAERHAVELDPRFTRAWLWVGETYLSRGQQEQALSAFRAAAAIEPAEPVSFKALGILLINLGKFEEAVTTLKSLITQTPDDPAGHYLLAVAYFALKRFPDAVTAYQAALKNAPQMAIVYPALGSALVLSGRMEEGIAAFKEAARLDPAPLNINNIAFELADKNIALDLALSYAIKAVSEQDKLSFNVKLSSLEQKDLLAVNAMASSWDTLGWVYFRMKKMPQARDYLEAAWTLSQMAPIASHLGQLYAATNRASDAARMFHFALLGTQQQKVADDIREQLQLLPVASRKETLTDMALAGELSSMRSVKLTLAAKPGSSAEYFVLFRRDPATAALQVEDVHYLTGTADLKEAARAVRAAHFPAMIPSTSGALVARRGILSCSEFTGCAITLQNPSDVRSVD